jgi:aryl-alcohol dehydrogenase-like predicted oxidoreductase
VVQATWNLLEPSAGPALADARSEGWGVIVKEVLANGRLTTRHVEPRLQRLQAYASAQGMTLEAFAIAAALAQPWADVVLCGAVTCSQLSGCLAALEPHRRPASGPCVAESADDYWRRRAALPWS